MCLATLLWKVKVEYLKTFGSGTCLATVYVFL